jgi:D-threonate/D-erythronate kinase
LAVIADDITGAADTGVQFLAAFAPVVLLDHRRLSVEAFEQRPRAISVFTSSRGLAAAEAGRVVLAAGRAIRGFKPQRVYKKIDSALRGHIGPELEAAMEALDRPVSFIAPAFPEQGRTTLGGVHYVHGMPVAATEMGRDPVTPVAESSLLKWIGGQTRFPVAHIAVEAIDAGLEAAAGEIKRQRLRGARHISFDATGTGHLDCIARLALERFPEALLCGSAGLARRLAGRLARGRPPEAAGPGAGLPADAGRFLFVCGSASEALRLQVAALAERGLVAVETLAPAALAGDGALPVREALLSRVVAEFREKDLVLQAAPPGKEAAAVEPQQLVRKLAEFAVAVITRATTAGLFLSGGDTAVAVLEQLEVEGVRLERELSSGVVSGTLLGGPMSGRPVVTKAGSFGRPDTLLDLHRRLRPPEFLEPGP